MSLLNKPQKLTLVFVNPVSGNQRGTVATGHALSLLLRESRRVLVYETDAADKAYSKLTKLEEAPGRVIAVGGDGTVNEVVRGLVARNWTHVPVGFLPQGTGNVLAKELRIPRDPRRAARVVERMNTHTLDVARVSGDRICLCCCGAGFDGTLVDEFHANRNGPLRQRDYVRYVIKYLRQKEWPPLTVTVDGEVLAEGAAWVEICNTRSYGGPIRFAPAINDDGLLDVVALMDPPCSHPISYAWYLMVRRRIDNHRAARYARGREITIEGPDGVRCPFQIDGDPGDVLPSRITLDGITATFIVP